MGNPVRIVAKTSSGICLGIRGTKTMKSEVIIKIILAIGGAIRVVMLLNPPGDPWATKANLQFLPPEQPAAVYTEWVVYWAGRILSVAIVAGLAWHFIRGRNPSDKKPD